MTENQASTDPDQADTIIKASNLVKHFGDVEAVRGINLEIHAGLCIGLLGPNGAGKTTTMRMLLGLTIPTAGDITLFGQRASQLSREARAKIGLVPQESNLDPDLSVEENLSVYGRYYGLDPQTIAERVPELLTFMKLEAKADAKVMHLSGGMKRRLIMARALIGDPELIILDEPTTGLDPQARVMIWRQLQALKATGKTMLLTTHYMDEAERLCDAIVVIDHGKVLDVDTPKGLIAKHVKKYVLEIEKPVPENLPIMDMENLGASVLFFLDELDATIERMPAGHAFTHRPANLEDVFLRLTGRQLREN